MIHLPRHGSRALEPGVPASDGPERSPRRAQLADYGSGKRISTTMRPMVADLNAEDFAALSRYFASKPTHKHEVADPGLSQVGVYAYERGNPYSGAAACAGRHATNGHGTDQLPRLAGQHAQHVEKQRGEFNSLARTKDNAIMHTVASKLTELEIKALSSFISGME